MHIVESIDPNGPFGAKEASEGPLPGTAPAIVAAIADATGFAIDRLPVTPDCILDAQVEARRRARRTATQGAS